MNECDVTSYLSPKSQHVIIFHLLTEGSGYARLEGTEGRPISLNAGDILIVPHGYGHLLGNGLPVTPVDRSQVIKQVLSQGLKVTRMGGGGDVTKFICGYMSCEPQLGRVFLAELPPILKVKIRDDASGHTSGQWLEQSIRHTVDTLDASKPGAKVVLAKLSEALFVETLRRYIAQLPQEQTGWLAGVREPEVGQARPCCIASLPILGRLRHSQFEGGRNFTLCAGREAAPFSAGNSDGLSHTVAATARRTNARLHKQQRGTDCR